jgi:hypothetical protein
MSDRREFWVPTELDIDAIKDADQRERVSGLIVEVNDGKISLQQLWNRFSASVDKDKVSNDDYWDIPLVIASLFNIPKAEDINDSIEKLLDKIDNIEAKLRNHRHDTTKTYSAKPEF